VRSAHQRSWQTCVLSVGLATVAGAFGGCTTRQNANTIWPPADFELQVEEIRTGPNAFVPERRFRVHANGLAVYSAAPETLVDEESGTVLPVWSRLAVYRLVEPCTRALARRVHRAGILELEPEQGRRGEDSDVGVQLRWQAFDNVKVVYSRGRVRGDMSMILAIVAAHLPPGERFRTPGVAERGIGSVLRGVPEPAADKAGAFRAMEQLLSEQPNDAELVLDAFVLACSAGRRADAERLLARWRALVGDVAEPPAGSGARALNGAILRRLLPAD